MADAKDAPRFSVSFYVINVIFKRLYVDSREIARIAINHVMFQSSNIRSITQIWFEHAAFGIVFKHPPRDPTNVGTLKTMVDKYILISCT